MCWNCYTYYHSECNYNVKRIGEMYIILYTKGLFFSFYRSISLSWNLDLHFFCLCISLAPACFLVGKDYNKDKTKVMKLIYMICKLSPFLFDFGGINNCFCDKELNVFQEVYSNTFSWGKSNTGKLEIWGKENQNFCGVRCTTQPLHLGSMVEMSHDFKSKDIISKRTGRAEVHCLIFWHSLHFYSTYSSLQPPLLSSTVTFITFFQNHRMV